MRKDIPKEVLEDLYLHKKKSLNEIGVILDTTGSTIRKRLQEYGIEIRPKSSEHWRKSLNFSSISTKQNIYLEKVIGKILEM